MSRPKGSKNHPRLIENPLLRRREPTFLSIPKDCLKIIHDRAKGSGLSPQMVLEDLIIAGDFTMGPAYDNLTNFRNRIRSKATQRNHEQPVTNSKEQTISENEGMDSESGGQNGHVGVEAIQERSHDATEQRGHRPEDNPAFRDPSGVGDVTAIVGEGSGYRVGIDPAYPDQEIVPAAPSEVQEEFSEFEEP